jgi:hypothetical protein
LREAEQGVEEKVMTDRGEFEVDENLMELGLTTGLHIPTKPALDVYDEKRTVS